MKRSIHSPRSSKHFSPGDKLLCVLAALILTMGAALPSWAQILVRLEIKGEGSPGDDGGDGPIVHDVKVAGPLTWAMTTEGLFEVGADTLRRRYPKEGEQEVTAIEEVAGEVWFGATSGVFRIVGAEYEPVAELAAIGAIDPAALRYDADRQSVWIGDQSGIWKYTPTEPAGTSNPQLLFESKSLSSLALFDDGSVWASFTREQIHRFDPNAGSEGFAPIIGSPTGMISFVPIGETVYMLPGGSVQTGGILYEFDISVGTINPREDLRDLFAIERIGDELWFSSKDNGIGRIAQGTIAEVKSLKDVQGIASCIKSLDDEILLATTKGLYRHARPWSEHSLELIAPVKTECVGEEDDGHILAWNGSSVYRLRENFQMEIELNSFKIGSAEILPFSATLRIEGISYRDKAGNTIDSIDKDSTFYPLIKDNKSVFDDRLSKGQFGNLQDEEDRTLQMRLLSHKIFYAAAKDMNGNVALIRRRHVVALGVPYGRFLLGILVYVLPAIVLFGILPWLPIIFIRFFVLLAMLPIVRWPLPGRWLLSNTNPGRRSIQRLYMSIAKYNAHDFSGTAESLASRDSLAPGQIVILEVPADEVRSRLEEVAFSGMTMDQGQWGHAFPIFLDFGDLSSETPIQVRLINKLTNSIDYVDTVFSESLLQHGRFIFLFAANADENAVLNYIREFVQDWAVNSAIVVGLIKHSNQEQAKHSNQEQAEFVLPSELPDCSKTGAKEKKSPFGRLIEQLRRRI